jgi:hypothetical protein
MGYLNEIYEKRKKRLEIKPLDVTFDTFQVKAKSHKLKLKWSVDMIGYKHEEDRFINEYVNQVTEEMMKTLMIPKDYLDGDKK